MKLTAGILSALVLLVLTVPVIILNGCGKENEAIPFGSTIVVNPVSSSWEAINVTSDITQDFRVVVTYSSANGGGPIPYANIVISGSLAAPAIPPVYQFFYYPGGEGNINGNVPVNSGFQAQTDERGVYSFSVVIYGPPSAFKDTIHVSSGAVTGTATLEVTTSTTGT